MSLLCIYCDHQSCDCDCNLCTECACDEEWDEWCDHRCPECHADVDHYLGCSEDPNPDYEAEVEYQRGAS